MNFNPGQLPTYESLFPVLTNQTTSQYKLVNGALLFLIVLAVIAPFTLDIPNVNRYSSPIKVVTPTTCFVKQYTGKECSMCGLTRSIVALYNGDLDLSIKFHPAGYLFVCLLFVELLLRVIPIVCSNKWIPRNLSMTLRHFRQQFSVSPDRFFQVPVC